MSLKSESAAGISGNAPDDIKERVAILMSRFMAAEGSFAHSVADRVRVTEVSINPKVEGPKKSEARVVCELTVEQDMLNGAGNIHGGCSAFLVDICTTLPLAAVTADGRSGVSQAINIIYHAPAQLGAKLRVVSTTITVGARAMSARCEIWDTTNQRLVASGTHVKMEASAAPKL